MQNQIPLLYSFRRCPYAIRARLAIKISGLRVILREIKLSHKAADFLQVSVKATVPVLVLEKGERLDESMDIMHWALRQNDPDHWLDETLAGNCEELVHENDEIFKIHLDQYKYHDRYPDHSQLYYRRQCEPFLQKLDLMLMQNRYLLAGRVTLADMALMPFIRQFAGVEKDWFATSPYNRLNKWLLELTQSSLFTCVMPKYAFWQNGDEDVYFPPL